MIFFTEIGNDNSPQNIIFQFYLKELPEGITFGRTTQLNKIKYNGGFQTNQIMGTFLKEVEWSGTFIGTYKNDKGGSISAKERSDLIYSLMGRPLRVFFPVPGQGPIRGEDNIEGQLSDLRYGGFKGVYIIEDYDPEVRNYSHVEYKIKLVPHQRQEKVKPIETTNVLVKPNVTLIESGIAKVRAAIKPGAPKTHVNAGKAVNTSKDISNKMNQTFNQKVDAREELIKKRVK